jgi:hypothetical protein
MVWIYVKLKIHILEEINKRIEYKSFYNLSFWIKITV